MTRTNRVIIALAAAVVMFSGCASHPEISDSSPSPCNDAVYLRLKSRPITEMSEREFEYFKEKDRACDEHQRQMTDIRATHIKEADHANAYIVASIATAIIGLWAVIMISTKSY